MPALSSRRSLVLLLVVAMIVVVAPSPSARAAGVVGGGTAASCTEAALDSALAGGGFVSFDCGMSATTITVTSQKTISSDTHIDGGGLVSISGGGSTGIFVVEAGVSLTLQGLTVTDGYVDTRGGAIYNNGGTVTISGGALSSNQAWQDFGGAIFNTNNGVVSLANVTVSDNFSNGGGAIFNDTGVVIIVDSTLSGNEGVGWAGALYNNDSMWVSGSTFSGNRGDDGGAIHNASGAMTVRESQFTSNGWVNEGRGPAVHVSGGSVLVIDSSFGDHTGFYGGTFANVGGELTVYASTIEDSTGLVQGGVLYNWNGTSTIVSSPISNTNAQNEEGGVFYNHGGTLNVTDIYLSNVFAGGNGGAVWNGGNGTATITSVTFDGTDASSAGAIWNDSGTVTISDISVLQARAGGHGGAIYNGGDMTISDSTVSGGSASEGGGIHQGAGTLSIVASTIAGNGGADFGGGLYVASGQVEVLRSTFTDNFGAYGGAIYNASGVLDIVGSTISGNNSGTGGGALLNRASGSMTLTGTILGANVTGFPNCSLDSPITSGGYNLSDDDSCSLGATGDIEDSVNVALGVLADNGGPTETMMPGATSDAVGQEQCSTFFDQRGAQRALDGLCDIGAVDVDGQVPVQVLAFFDSSGPILEGSAATVVALVSGPAGASYQYQFDCSGGNDYSTPGVGTGTRGTGSCTYSDEGTYDVSVLVCDSTFSSCAQGETTVEVANVAPAVAAPTVTQTGTATVSLVELAAVIGPGSDEGDIVVASAPFHDPGTSDTHTCTVDYGDGDGPEPGTVVDSTCVGPEHTYLEDHPGRSVTMVVTDDDGAHGHGRAGHEVHNRHPVLHEFLAPIDPVAVGETVHASLEFSDPGVLDTHSAEWDWGDGTTSAAVVTESDGSGIATGSHVYTAAGLYTLTVTLVDDDTGVATTSHEHVKVHEPGAGFVSGAGTFESPAGAYQADPSFTGGAHFNFVARYDQGEALNGRFRLRLQKAGLRFESNGHETLTSAGAWARIEGTGTINGRGTYEYLLTVVDGAWLDGGDAIRIRIRERQADGSPGPVVYDSQVTGDTHDAALPTVEVTRGSIVIRR